MSRTCRLENRLMRIRWWLLELLNTNRCGSFKHSTLDKSVNCWMHSSYKLLAYTLESLDWSWQYLSGNCDAGRRKMFHSFLRCQEHKTNLRLSPSWTYLGLNLELSPQVLISSLQNAEVSCNFSMCTWKHVCMICRGGILMVKVK